MKADLFKIGINEIKIPIEFKNSTPAEWKLERKREILRENGKLPSVTIRDLDFMLLDGYTTYLVALENNIEYLDACLENEPKTELQDEVDNPISSTSRIRKRKRERVYSSSGGKCYICGRQLFLIEDEGCDGTNIFTIDHRVPLIKGGSDSIDNMEACCNLCNALKGKFTYTDKLKEVIIDELKSMKLL